MLLRVSLGLLCLAAIALAQSENGTMPGAGESLKDRYDGQQAVKERRRHFYCLEVGSTIGDFPQTENTTENANLDVPPPTPRPFLWAIFLQYPVLSYLDSQRKGALIEAILNITKRGATIELGPTNDFDALTSNEICIANVAHYSVADYEESVLINIHFLGDVVFNIGNREDMPPFSIADFNRFFEAGFTTASAEGVLVRRFEGRDAIVVKVPDVENDMTETELNQHPGLLTAEEDDDPTRRAVFLGSYDRGMTIEEALRNRTTRSFASNPDPTNFGLEAGDIVFAVFGSIFLTAVGIMTLLGFCIHPFFLA